MECFLDVLMMVEVTIFCFFKLLSAANRFHCYFFPGVFASLGQVLLCAI